MINLRTASLTSALLITLTTPCIADASITGRASVIDGDTLDIQGQRIRLHGVDAPESGQFCKRDGKNHRCGQEAALALADIIGSRTVRCDERGRDRYGRSVAVCRIGNLDLNGWLARRGHAAADRRYSQDYVAQEAQARAERAGIWAGRFDMPWDWRKSRRAANENAAQRAAKVPMVGSSCTIKGNISAKGERLYHRPGSRFYARTKIDTSRGERMFCSAREAEAAGWRPAGR
jgi:endonuclease YncB( thermonuclease family)